MTEEWFLTLTDVADALACTRGQVDELIERGELTLAPGRQRRIAHSELCAFVTRIQSDAMALGVEPFFTPSLVASRPTTIVDNHDR
jgi:excisionase family DNA binding protein